VALHVASVPIRRSTRTKIPLPTPVRTDVLRAWPVHVFMDVSRAVEPSQSEVDAVLASLADEAWVFRTVRGIAAETGLAEGRVQQILETYSNLVRHPKVASGRARDLWTLKSRPPGWRERYLALKEQLATW
jgi:hypothetical protein